MAFLIIPEPEYSRRTHRSVVAVVTSPTTLVSAVARDLSRWQQGHCGCRIEPVRTTGSRSMICGTSRNGTVTCALRADMLTRGWDVMRHQRGAARIAASATVTDEPPKPRKKAARTASRQRTEHDVRGCGTHASPPSSGLVTAWPVAESSPTRVNSRKTAAVWQYLSSICGMRRSRPYARGRERWTRGSRATGSDHTPGPCIVTGQASWLKAPLHGAVARPLSAESLS